MILASISILDKPNVPFVESKFSDESEAMAWFKSYIPSLPIERLRFDSQMTFDETYSVLLKFVEEP